MFVVLMHFLPFTILYPLTDFLSLASLGLTVFFNCFVLLHFIGQLLDCVTNETSSQR